MASVVKIKRSSVQGKAPTISDLQAGELALNTRDGKLFSSDGSNIFEIGANVNSLSVGTGGFSIANSTITFPTSDGPSGYFLKTNGSGTLSWDTAAGALGSAFVSNTYFQPILANTNLAVADRMQVANVIAYTAKYLEVANSSSTGEVSNAQFQSYIANTNPRIEVLENAVNNNNLSGFPFFKSDGTQDNIHSTNGGEFPFYLSNGTQDNIVVTF